MAFELRRKLFHVAAGTVALGLVLTDSLHVPFFTGLLLTGLALSMLSLRYDLPGVAFFIDYFDRDLHQRVFPGKGAITLLGGILAAVVLFERPVTLAAIIAVTYGDSLSHIVGRYFGRVPNPINPDKEVEGFLVATAAITLPNTALIGITPGILVSIAAMIAESMPTGDGRFAVDDNLSVPLTVGIVHYALMVGPVAL